MGLRVYETVRCDSWSEQSDESVESFRELAANAASLNESQREGVLCAVLNALPMADEILRLRQKIHDLNMLIALANEIMPAISGYENVDPCLVSPYLIAHERIQGAKVPNVDRDTYYDQTELDAELARRAKR